MAEAVSYLIENHDLILEIEPFPYIPGRGRAMINDGIFPRRTRGDEELPWI
jgi:hypothetical protein